MRFMNLIWEAPPPAPEKPLKYLKNQKTSYSNEARNPEKQTQVISVVIPDIQVVFKSVRQAISTSKVKKSRKLLPLPLTGMSECHTVTTHIPIVDIIVI
jgi:hypothetical protein